MLMKTSLEWTQISDCWNWNGQGRQQHQQQQQEQGTSSLTTAPEGNQIERSDNNKNGKRIKKKKKKKNRNKSKRSSKRNSLQQELGLLGLFCPTTNSVTKANANSETNKKKGRKRASTQRTPSIVSTTSSKVSSSSTISTVPTTNSSMVVKYHHPPQPQSQQPRRSSNKTDQHHEHDHHEHLLSNKTSGRNRNVRRDTTCTTAVTATKDRHRTCSSNEGNQQEHQPNQLVERVSPLEECYIPSSSSSWGSRHRGSIAKNTKNTKKAIIKMRNTDGSSPSTHSITVNMAKVTTMMDSKQEEDNNNNNESRSVRSVGDDIPFDEQRDPIASSSLGVARKDDPKYNKKVHSGDDEVDKVRQGLPSSSYGNEETGDGLLTSYLTDICYDRRGTGGRRDIFSSKFHGDTEYVQPQPSKPPRPCRRQLTTGDRTTDINQSTIDSIRESNVSTLHPPREIVVTTNNVTTTTNTTTLPIMIPSFDEIPIQVFIPDEELDDLASDISLDEFCTYILPTDDEMIHNELVDFEREEGDAQHSENFEYSVEDDDDDDDWPSDEDDCNPREDHLCNVYDGFKSLIVDGSTSTDQGSACRKAQE